MRHVHTGYQKKKKKKVGERKKSSVLIQTIWVLFVLA